MNGSITAFIVVIIAIKGLVLTTHAGFHLHHILGRDAKILSHRLDLFVVEPAKMLLGLAQIEEELTLGLGGGHLDHTPVAQYILMDFRLDPVHGKGDQPDTDARVKAFDRLHQPDITFLN